MSFVVECCGCRTLSLRVLWLVRVDQLGEVHDAPPRLRVVPLGFVVAICGCDFLLPASRLRDLMLGRGVWTSDGFGFWAKLCVGRYRKRGFATSAFTAASPIPGRSESCGPSRKRAWLTIWGGRKEMSATVKGRIEGASEEARLGYHPRGETKTYVHTREESVEGACEESRLAQHLS